MITDKNIKSVIKYNGYSPLVKVENTLPREGRLFAAKLSNGYCFFQAAGGISALLESGEVREFLYIIFYERLFQEISKNIGFLKSEKYFYKRRCFKSELEVLIGTKGMPLKTSHLTCGKYKYYDLGVQELPSDITP